MKILRADNCTTCPFFDNGYDEYTTGRSYCPNCRLLYHLESDYFIAEACDELPDEIPVPYCCPLPVTIHKNKQ